jgi:hypothetical protein
MAQAYSDPTREADPHTLPDLEVFEVDDTMIKYSPPAGWKDSEPGWYWWACFPGCLPDCDPVGPFDTEAEALADAQQEV